MRRFSSLLVSLGLLAVLVVAGARFPRAAVDRTSGAPAPAPGRDATSAADDHRAGPTDMSPDISQPDPAVRDDAEYQAAVVGTWEDDYQGKRTMTLQEDGTGTMIVELSGMSATLFATRLEFDMVWSVENGRLKKQTIGGRPENRVAMILKMMGDRVDEPILELTAERLVLLDQDGETRYEWRRKKDE